MPLNWDAFKLYLEDAMRHRQHQQHQLKQQFPDPTKSIRYQRSVGEYHAFRLALEYIKSHERDEVQQYNESHEVLI
jgi:hypothetical protein